MCDANHSDKSGCHSITCHNKLEPPHPCKIKAFRGFLASIYHEVCAGLTSFPDQANLPTCNTIAAEGKIMFRRRGSAYTSAINSPYASRF